MTRDEIIAGLRATHIGELTAFGEMLRAAADMLEERDEARAAYEANLIERERDMSAAASELTEARALGRELRKRLEALVYASEALARKEYKHDGCTFESVALAEQEDAAKVALAKAREAGWLDDAHPASREG